ncbi:hypothetical protein HH195_12385 (plasmid) [Sarcina sp. JB2]|uniref:Uncharacterized protein n=1 Tax=Candidatus Sarcina troglodytae TaxID=2726954 RepID=A0ACD1BIA6_9CLOT|nr:PH domain-containing protein [Sarcina sp. JB2]QPJ86762.1 hypothetical protein HH195_12385 [Sarcina sp. JB2]
MVLFSRKSEEQIQAEKELKIKKFLNEVSIPGLNENNIDYNFILNRNSVFRKEVLFELKSMLIENEKVEYLTSASIKLEDLNGYSSCGVLACTNKRILFSGKVVAKILFKNFTRNQIPIEKINSIHAKKGWNSSVSISDEATVYCFSTSFDESIKFIELVNKMIKELKEENNKVTQSSNEDDIIIKLERLTSLKEKGILDETEFEIQKKKILESL